MSSVSGGRSIWTRPSGIAAVGSGKTAFRAAVIWNAFAYMPGSDSDRRAIRRTRCGPASREAGRSPPSQDADVHGTWSWQLGQMGNRLPRTNVT